MFWLHSDFPYLYTCFRSVTKKILMPETAKQLAFFKCGQQRQLSIFLPAQVNINQRCMFSEELSNTDHSAESKATVIKAYENEFSLSSVNEIKLCCFTSILQLCASKIIMHKSNRFLVLLDSFLQCWFVSTRWQCPKLKETFFLTSLSYEHLNTSWFVQRKPVL